MTMKKARTEAGAKAAAEDTSIAKPEKKVVTTTSKTPNKDAFFSNLKAVIARCSALGSCMIRGIQSDDDEEDDEEEDEDEEKEKDKEYTVEQLATLRYVLVNSARDKALQKAMDFATCGQADDSVMMFNTSSGNMVILGIPRELAKINKKKALPEKFDALFALTYALNRQDYWLGAAWKKMLAHSNEELGIDEEFTRPGIVALLEDFKEKIGEAECVEGEFKWQ